MPFIEKDLIPLRFRHVRVFDQTRFRPILTGWGVNTALDLLVVVSDYALLMICVLTNGGQVNMSWDAYLVFPLTLVLPHECTAS